jgi:hypothetical protein
MTSYLAVVRHCDKMLEQTLAFSSDFKELCDFLKTHKIRLSKMENYVETKNVYVDGLIVNGIFALSEKQIKRLNLPFQHSPEYWFLYIIASNSGCQDLQKAFLELGQCNYFVGGY